MIAKLSGLVDSIGEDWVIVDVSGVGYLVSCSNRTLTGLPGVGNPVSLLIDTHVREDHIHLYGFEDRSEQHWYRLLCTVQGVGAKMALAVLSVLPTPNLVQAIAAQDTAALTRANGVGPKVAGRIVAELKDKASDLSLGSAAVNGDGGRDRPAATPLSDDAISVLINLGYGRGEAFSAVARATRQMGAEAPLEALVTAGLRELAT